MKLAGITIGLSLFLLNACFDASKTGVQFAAQVQPAVCPTSLPQTVQCFHVTGTAIGQSRAHWRVLDRIALVGDGPAVDLPFYCIPSTTRGQLLGSVGTVRFSGSGYFCPRPDSAEFRYRLVDSKDAVNGLVGVGLILYDGHSNVERFAPARPTSHAPLSMALITVGADSRRAQVFRLQARKPAVLDSRMPVRDLYEPVAKLQPSDVFEDPWDCVGMFVENSRPVHATRTLTADLDARGLATRHGEGSLFRFDVPDIRDSGEAAGRFSAYVFDNFSDVRGLVSLVWAGVGFYPDQCANGDATGGRLAFEKRGVTR